MRGTISRNTWDVPVDLFFFRDPEELEKMEDVAQESTGINKWNKDVAQTAEPTFEVVEEVVVAATVDGGW